MQITETEGDLAQKQKTLELATKIRKMSAQLAQTFADIKKLGDQYQNIEGQDLETVHNELQKKQEHAWSYPVAYRRKEPRSLPARQFVKQSTVVDQFANPSQYSTTYRSAPKK